MMTCRNSIKNKNQNVFSGCFNMLSIDRKITDDQMECTQFGICDYALEKLRKFPFFIINLF